MRPAVPPAGTARHCHPAALPPRSAPAAVRPADPPVPGPAAPPPLIPPRGARAGPGPRRSPSCSHGSAGRGEERWAGARLGPPSLQRGRGERGPFDAPTARPDGRRGAPALCARGRVQPRPPGLPPLTSPRARNAERAGGGREPDLPGSCRALTEESVREKGLQNGATPPPGPAPRRAQRHRPRSATKWPPRCGAATRRQGGAGLRARGAGRGYGAGRGREPLPLAVGHAGVGREALRAP